MLVKSLLLSGDNVSLFGRSISGDCVFDVAVVTSFSHVNDLPSSNVSIIF